MKNSRCTEDDRENKRISVGLKHPDALILCGENEKYYGGDQAWFSDIGNDRLPEKGCGIVSAANICAYLAASDDKYRPLYSGKASRADFTAHMNEMSRWLKAGAFGIWSIRRFTNGVRAFAASRGVALEARYTGSFSAEKAARFIGEALAADKPAAMLIGFSRPMKSVRCCGLGGESSDAKFTAHWVTVTELTRENGRYTVKVSSWGKYAYISLDDYAEKELFKKALIYFF